MDSCSTTQRVSLHTKKGLQWWTGGELCPVPTIQFKEKWNISCALLRKAEVFMILMPSIKWRCGWSQKGGKEDAAVAVIRETYEHPTHLSICGNHHVSNFFCGLPLPSITQAQKNVTPPLPEKNKGTINANGFRKLRAAAPDWWIALKGYQVNLAFPSPLLLQPQQKTPPQWLSSFNHTLLIFSRTLSHFVSFKNRNHKPQF